MGQEWFNDLALMSIESEELEAISLDEVITNFAGAKLRKNQI